MNLCDRCEEEIRIENRKYELDEFAEKTNESKFAGESVGAVSNNHQVEVGDKSY